MPGSHGGSRPASRLGRSDGGYGAHTKYYMLP